MISHNETSQPCSALQKMANVLWPILLENLDSQSFVKLAQLNLWFSQHVPKVPIRNRFNHQLGGINLLSNNLFQEIKQKLSTMPFNTTLKITNDESAKIIIPKISAEAKLLSEEIDEQTSGLFSIDFLLFLVGLSLIILGLTPWINQNEIQPSEVLRNNIYLKCLFTFLCSFTGYKLADYARGFNDPFSIIKNIKESQSKLAEIEKEVVTREDLKSLLPTKLDNQAKKELRSELRLLENSKLVTKFFNQENSEGLRRRVINNNGQGSLVFKP